MKKLNFFVILLLTLVVFIGLTAFVFDISGWKFYLEFIILLGLMFFTLVGMVLIFNDIVGGYVITAIVSAVTLLNFIMIYFRTYMSTLLFLSLISSMTAFVVSVVNIGSKGKRKKAMPKPAEKPVVKTYIPGKVVSSLSSNVYHIPNCDWAKKIRKSNQVWHETVEDAKKQGLKAHTCAK